MTTDPKTCKHTAIAVSANTHAQLLPNNEVGARLLSVKAQCNDCGTPFWFPGLGTGTDYTKATSSTDGFTLTTPLVEANKQNMPDPSLVSVNVRTSDNLKGIYRA